MIGKLLTLWANYLSNEGADVDDGHQSIIGLMPIGLF